MTSLQKRSFITVLGIGFLIWLLATIAFRVAGPASRAATFGSWLMWAYTIVLITSLIRGLKQPSQSHR